MYGHLGSFSGTPSRASHKDLYKIVQKPLTACTRNCQKPSPNSSCQTPKNISQGRRKNTCWCWRGSYKILAQEPPKSLVQELSYRHLQAMASARSSCKDLLEKIRQGFPQDLLLRTCTGWRRDLLKKEVIRISTTACHKDLCKITQGPLKGVSKIFTGSSQKGLYKIMQEPPTGYRPRSFQHPLASLQDVGQDLQMLRARKTAPWNPAVLSQTQRSVLKASGNISKHQPTGKRLGEKHVGC